MLAALVICLIGLAVAQRPIPCTTPAQWEGRVFDINEQSNFRVEGRLSYDQTYHRERLVDEVDVGVQDDFYDTIALFDAQVEFVYNFKVRNCTRRPLTRPWRDFGIRQDATSYGEAYVGTSATPGDGVLVTIWGGNFTTPNGTVDYISSWTLQGCVPVTRTTFSPAFGTSHISWYDVTAGIRDPNVFVPRRECLSNDEWENRFTLFGATPKNKF